MNRILPFLWSVVSVASAIAMGIGVANVTRESSWLSRRVAPVPVEAVQVRRVRLNRDVRGQGELTPLRQADIAATIPGIVEEVRYKVGDSVAAGQVVATIRATELIARLQQAQTALKKAQEDLKKKETDLDELKKKLERTRELRDRDLIAAQDVTAAETAVEIARAQTELGQAQVAQQQATVDQLRYLLQFSKVVAPFKGVVTRRPTSPGASIQRGDAILSIADMEFMKVSVELSGHDVDSIRPGMPAGIQTENKRHFEGKVVSLHSASDTTDAKLMEVQFENSARLLQPGTTVSITVSTGESREALLIPKQAVLESGGKNYVDVVVGDRVRKQPLTPGETQGSMIEAVNGVREGDWIVVASPRPLVANSRVRITGELPGMQFK